MCGITGWVNYKDNIINHRKIIQSMTDTLALRGPNEVGYYCHNNVLLGHRRLTVIDPEGGKQPMTREIGQYKYTIVYNGELYNTEEIREELKKKGHYFLSHSDTEVLLVAYIEWGEDCVYRLNGIYAFAVWEDYTNTLFMARDRLGVKPLFYANIDSNFIFASEIKALLKHPDIEPILKKDGVLELFGLGPSRSLGHGIFHNINELKPAEYIILTPKTTIKKIYWQIKPHSHSDSREKTIEVTSELVEDAIKRQLVSDVGICTFLSGGLDSSGISAIAALHEKEQGRILKTYSLDYEGNDKYFKGDYYQPTSDNYWVNVVSKHIGSEHHRFVVDNSLLALSLYNSVEALDLPGMADIDSSLYLFCEKVKEDNTVALSGECADEIFGGYPWFRDLDDIYFDGFPWNKHLDFRKSILSGSIRNLPYEDYVYSKYMDTVKELDFIEPEDEHSKRIKMLTYLNIKWFMITLLNRKDRMSMSNSLEVRVPYADHRLIEYTFNIPWELKYENDVEKSLLREALKRFLPEEVAFRKKSPYPKTYNPKYENLVKLMLQEVIDNKNAPVHQLIDKKSLKGILDQTLPFEKPWFGQLMKGPQFLAYIVQLNYWLEKYKVKIEV
ncbi:asparagine synthase (glutamine-hydrolysing) [Natranaerovirga pectinivora]|uniref:asparagine synthase (glutamine-hydrolyzing) n=1 Tax=Natranaerovirga pectinivora TaxID=682400 RepID=A0A4R3MM61_9FIRM|nr:asparagine synthase (glutamine-hydrolyzing) [Natranaerovirga pectinivora]TCT14925.1 asparagine synthase (glutamine-hydrolysing) [Natranaerovirga pectinivora]